MSKKPMRSIVALSWLMIGVIAIVLVLFVRVYYVVSSTQTQVRAEAVNSSAAAELFISKYDRCMESFLWDQEACVKQALSYTMLKTGAVGKDLQEVRDAVSPYIYFESPSPKAMIKKALFM